MVDVVCPLVIGKKERKKGDLSSTLQVAAALVEQATETVDQEADDQHCDTN